MISSFDDFLAHQAPTPIAQPGTTDVNFTDRYYFNAYSPDGDSVLIVGMTQYPNRGLSDAFALARTDAERQHVTRASRELNERADTTVGPISVEVLEPLRRLRLTCEPAAGAIGLDLEWASDCEPIEEPPMIHRTDFGRLVEDGTRFVQTGSWHGTMRIGDREFVVDGDWNGSRDHSWGVRRLPEPSTARTRRPQHVPDGMILWAPMRFAHATIHLVLFESSDGERRRVFCRQVPHLSGESPVEDLDIIGVNFDVRLPTHAFTTGELLLRYRRSKEVLRIAADAGVVAALGAGTGYGGAGESDWIHGMYQGPLTVEHKSYDFEAALASGSTTTTVATFEASDPLLGRGDGVIDLRIDGEMANRAVVVGEGRHRVQSTYQET